LENRMREYGLTASGLAEAVNDHVAAATGEPGRYTDRDVRRLLAGATRWPHKATRNALEEILKASALELGFVPRAGSTLRPTPGVPCGQDHLPKDDRMKRRNVLLGIIGGVVISIQVPALPKRGRLGMSDVERLRGPLGELFSYDDRVGGVALADAAVHQADLVLAATEKYETSVLVGDAMYGLAGEYLAAAGWFAVDAGELTTANSYLDRALRLATLAGDHSLQAQVWNYLAMRARQARAYHEARHIARAGLASPAARNNPRVAALFHARVAHSHAWAGDKRLADRAMGRAWEALGRVTADTPTPVWSAFVDEAQLWALHAIGANAVGDYTAAAKAATEDLRLLPSAYVRNRVHGRLHLVDALLGAREPEQAAREATTALEHASALNGALHTGRVAARLRHTRRRLAAWPEVASGWVHRYDAAIAA
jgi:tetratricopeptide (TPR) repeat protein